MRRVESLDHKVADNILKTDAIITRLGDLNTRLTDDDPLMRDKIASKASSAVLNNRLLSLDQKVSDIDTKIGKLKTQIDNNFLSVDDINAEASEKKPIHMNVADITRAMNSEVMSHVTKDLDILRKTTEAIDKKLQFHVHQRINFLFWNNSFTPKNCLWPIFCFYFQVSFFRSILLKNMERSSTKIEFEDSKKA